MPIFMDLHDNANITPEAAAKAHLEDIKIQHKYNCKIITLWVDEPRHKAFCLFEAPDSDAVLELHKNSHGEIPFRIIEVKVEMINTIYGRITEAGELGNLDELGELIVETPYRTLMQVETKNALLASKGSGKDNLLCANEFFREIINNVIKNYYGRELKNIMVGCIISFDSIEKAINCALEIQKKLNEYNKKTNEDNILAVIALDIGSPVSDSKELFGKSISLLKRICAIGKEGQVIASSSIRDISKSGNFSLNKDSYFKLLNQVEERFLNQLMTLTEKMWNDEKFNLDNFSREIGLSKTHLYRKVMALTGYPPNVFIREYKLNRALRAIEKMKGNIAEIAIESGFTNPSYFSKCFQKKFGILPSEYANTLA